MKRTITVLPLTLLFCISGVSVVFAQSENAKPCQMDLSLKVGRTVTDYLFLNLILVEGQPQESEPIQYTVRGNGYYEKAGSGDSGRLRIESGSWDSSDNDADRHIIVIFVSGPNKDLQYTVNLPLIVDGTVSGMWVDGSNPQNTGSASGTTTCNQ